MNDSKQKHLSIPEVMISVIVKIVILVGMYYICTIFNLPMGLTASLILFALLSYLTLSNYNSLDKPKRVCFVGLTLAAFVLSSLFAYKHFVSDIRITVLHIGGIILAPFFLWKVLEKKAKNE